MHKNYRNFSFTAYIDFVRLVFITYLLRYNCPIHVQQVPDCPTVLHVSDMDTLAKLKCLCFLASTVHNKVSTLVGAHLYFHRSSLSVFFYSFFYSVPAESSEKFLKITTSGKLLGMKILFWNTMRIFPLIFFSFFLPPLIYSALHLRRLLIASSFNMQGFPTILQGVPLNEYTRKYAPPFDEFEVDRCILPLAASVSFPSVPGPSLFLVMSGKGTIVTSYSEESSFQEGEVLFVPAYMEVSITATATELHMYRAGVNNRVFGDL